MMTATPSRPSSRSKQWLLTAWLIGPFAAVVLLVVVIAYRDPASIRMFAPPVGAGAGRTGGANAIGELLAGNDARHNANAPEEDPARESRATEDPARESRATEDPARESRATEDPARESRATEDPARESRATEDPARESRATEDPARESRATEDPARRAGPPKAEELVAVESLPQGFILVVEDKARRATQTSPLYLASNLYSNWNPGAKESMLTAQSDMRWRIELPQPAAWKDGKTGSELAFKFTRGSWDLEELNADLSKPGNRTLAKIDASKLAAGEKPVIEMSVATWSDMAAGYVASAGDADLVPVKATGDVRRLQIVGGSGGAEGKVRDCLVWLPAGYDDAANAGVKYPVVYMFDGQNLFEKHKGVPAEWGADETAAGLIAAKKIGGVGAFIIVGIPNSGATRISEYLPVDALPGAAKPGGAGVGGFMEFVVTQIKPRVERAFRVETERTKVALGGSSLGGAMALYGAMEYPDQFGLVLAESLPLRTGDAKAWRSWLDAAAAKRAGDRKLPARVFLGYGTLEYGKAPSAAEVNGLYAKDMADLRGMLIAAGMNDKAVMLTAAKDAEHTESAWAARLPAALEFLLGP